ncbi:MAG TPA: FdtA/QdtA family cupin domain-containing protein [Pyrinomonadaceae bacterium]|nr:FdtA/QdtA family cupin domain-containing protein [Pyrinomonadaceae bacterium]
MTSTNSTSIKRPVSVADCHLIELPRINDPRGNLTYIESDRQIPFALKRVFYLYDVPGGAMRAGHALKSCHQFIVANSGSFDAIIDDGFEKRRFPLNRSYLGLYVPPLLWREMENFSYGSVCTVLASEFYDETDYIRDYQEFLSTARSGR